MIYFQIIIALWIALDFFVNLYSDFHGLMGRPPKGFLGACSSIVVLALKLIVAFKAGAFSLLIK